MSTVYCLDTSALVDPWRRYYPIEIFPSIWEHLDRHIAQGRILACAEVQHELEQRDDELLAYAKKKDGLFIPLDMPQQQLVSIIMNTFPSWVNAESTKNTADPFVIALAKHRGLTVVTYETKAGPGANKVKIPNVCDHFSVPYVNYLGFLRATGFRK